MVEFSQKVELCQKLQATGALVVTVPPDLIHLIEKGQNPNWSTRDLFSDQIWEEKRDFLEKMMLGSRKENITIPYMDCYGAKWALDLIEIAALALVVESNGI